MRSNLILGNQAGYSGNDYVLAMDGVDDYLALGSATNYHFSDSHIQNTGVTITAWVYLNASPSTYTPIICIGRSGTNSYYGMHVGINSADKVVMHLMGLNGGVAGAGSNNRRTRVQTGSTLNIGAWNHVAVVFDGGMASTTVPNWKIVVDGIDKTTNNSGTNAALTLNYSGNSFIGQNGKASSINYFKAGYLGDVTIHSQKLTPTIIKDVYSSKSDGIDWKQAVGGYTAAMVGNLVGWWRMGDDSKYPTLNDEGSFTYNATMTNMTDGDIVTTPVWG